MITHTGVPFQTLPVTLRPASTAAENQGHTSARSQATMQALRSGLLAARALARWRCQTDAVCVTTCAGVLRPGGGAGGRDPHYSQHVLHRDSQGGDRRACYV